MAGRHRSVVAATVIATLALALLPTGMSQATGPAARSGPAQCFFDSSSRGVRIWWDEARGNSALSGDDRGSARDGSCATVPPSVPWVAAQSEALIRLLKATGLPMTQSDKGIQGIVKQFSDYGSGAFDIRLDGAPDEFEQASTGCAGVAYFRSGRWHYRTKSTMVIRDVAASAPDTGRATQLRAAIMHELVHVAQCAILNPGRQVSASNLNGAWIEAVPQALGLGQVGGSGDVGLCRQNSKILSAGDGNLGYGQWPFWYALLGPSGGKAYAQLLREVIGHPLSQAGPQLERALRKHYSAAQLSRALVALASAGYFGGTLPSASGTPITWRTNDLLSAFGYLVDEATGAESPHFDDPIVGVLDPTVRTPVSRSVVIPAMGCGALLVSWPENAQTISVGATGAPSGDLGSVMAVGVDASPGSDPASPCGSRGARTVVPFVNGQFVAARSCTQRSSPPVWVLMANGSASPLRLTVTASAS